MHRQAEKPTFDEINSRNYGPGRCRVCGVEVGKLKSYCSQECRFEREFARRRMVRAARGWVLDTSSDTQRERALKLWHGSPPEQITCKTCGRQVKKKGIRQRYCSRQCAFQDLDWKKSCGPKPKEAKRCARCNSEVTSRVAKYCEDCRAVAYREQMDRHNAARRIVTTERTCIVCQVVFLGGPYRRTCSSFCSSQLHRSARHAKERGVEVEVFSHIQIFARDKWRCHICGVKTPRELRGVNAPNSPELDHVVPLSRGGKHSRTNVRCACRACNQAKSNDVIGQLGLDI